MKKIKKEKIYQYETIFEDNGQGYTVTVPKLPRIPSLLVIKALKRARFYEYHRSGSHIQLRHFDKRNLRITIPCAKNFTIHN